MRIVIAMIIVGLILVAGCLRSIGGEQYALDYVENMKRTPISPETLSLIHISEPTRPY